MSATLLRQKYNAQFVGLPRYANWIGWAIVIAYVGQMILAVLLGHIVLTAGISASSGVLILFLVVFVGTRFRALNNVVHETSHATFVKDRAQNVAIGKLCSALTMGSFLDYRDEHLSHHAHLGDYSRDLDFRGIERLALHDPLSGRVLARHVFTPLVGRHLPYYLHLNLSNRDGTLFFGIKIALLVLVAAITILAPATSLVLLLVPYVLIYSALNYWADCMDHAGLVGGVDELDKSRNVLAPRVLAWLFFPRFDGFHLVHHLFPQVPARHLAATHQTLSRDSLYQAKPNAVGGRARRAGTRAAH